jgi:GNAT superfamily N-acetyltransferase
MRRSITLATEDDVADLVALHGAVAQDLTRRHGSGHWSFMATERGVLRSIRTNRVLLARNRSRIVGTLALQTKKPWAIDVRYFTPVLRAIYLTGMAVLPSAQRRGVGRQLIEAAVVQVRAWPGQAIRLDAYDAIAGAGPFYSKTGFGEVGRVVYKGNPLIYFERLLVTDPEAERAHPAPAARG